MKKNIIIYFVLLVFGIIGVTLGIVVPNAVEENKNTYTATSTTSLIEGKSYNINISLKDKLDVDFVRVKFNSNLALVSKDKDYTIDYPYNEIRIDGKKIHIDVVLDEATDVIKMGLVQKIWVFDAEGKEYELENAEWKVPTQICVAGASGILSGVSLILLLVALSSGKKKTALISELSNVFDGVEKAKISYQDLKDLKLGIETSDGEENYFENKSQMLKIVKKYNLKKKD